jgi:hypothetical protein
MGGRVRAPETSSSAFVPQRRYYNEHGKPAAALGSRRSRSEKGEKMWLT